jgi:hypothetical protein
MTDAAARTMPDLRLGLHHPHRKLVRAVLDAPRLLAVIPAGPLDDLIAAHDAATTAAAAARQLPVEADDFEAEIDATLRAGSPVDPAELLARMGATQAAREHRDATLRLLDVFPGRFEGEIVNRLVSHLDDYYAVLRRELEDLLNRAEVADAALSGITTAEEAIDSGLAAEFAEVRALSREYHSLRQSHLSLFNYEKERNYGNGAAMPGKDLTGFALFAGVADDIADYRRIARGEITDMEGKPLPVPLPWPVLDTSSLEHFLRSVRNRATLRPHVATADEAFDAASSVVIHEPNIAVPATREAGQLVPGTQQFEHMMRRARNAAADRIADERESLL